jgi:hypothetical protein
MYGLLADQDGMRTMCCLSPSGQSLSPPLGMYSPIIMLLHLTALQIYNGRTFERVDLCSLGLVLQLGHDGGACTLPGGPSVLTIIDIHGLQRVRVRYCQCTAFQPKYRQLLRAGFFPATETRPKTAVSFAFLWTFHRVTLASKLNLYDYFLFVLIQGDPLGFWQSVVSVMQCSVNLPSHVPLAQHALFGPVSLVVRMWRDLVALKRAGRAHDTSGIDGTQPGGLAMLCPACPCPGYNLPDNWRDLAKSDP